MLMLLDMPCCHYDFIELMPYALRAAPALDDMPLVTLPPAHAPLQRRGDSHIAYSVLQMRCYARECSAIIEDASRGAGAIRRAAVQQ